MHRVIFLLLALVSTRALAADEGPRWTLQVDPLTTALGFVHLQVERALHPRLSVYLGPHARLFEGSRGGGDFVGYGGELGVCVFLRPSAPEGWWGQVRGVVASLRTPDDDTAAGGYVSALAGYTAIFDGWFVLAGGLGVQYVHYSVAGLGTEGVLPAAHTAVGVAF